MPTPLAVALASRVSALTAEVRGLLSGDAAPQLAVVERTLRIRTNSGAAGPWTRPLVAAIRARAPHVTLSFVGEGDERPDDLREGRVDLDVGVLGPTAPELRTQALYRDRFVCVVRKGHPLARGRCTAARVAKYDHVGVSRRGRFHGPIDAALRAPGLSRNVVATVATNGRGDRRGPLRLGHRAPPRARGALRRSGGPSRGSTSPSSSPRSRSRRRGTRASIGIRSIASPASASSRSRDGATGEHREQGCERAALGAVMGFVLSALRAYGAVSCASRSRC